MIAICVDDEPILLKWLVSKVESSPDIEKAVGFLTAEEAIEYSQNNKFDIAFLDVEIGSIGGIELAKALREKNAKCGIIFCTGHANYAVDAISELSVNGYLLKPIEAIAIQREITRYKNSIISKNFVTVNLSHGIEIFDSNGKLVIFKRKRTENLFVELVKRNGESMTVREICTFLWGKVEDVYLFEKNRQYLTQLFLDLRKTFENIGIDDILKKTSTGYALTMSFIRYTK